MNARPPSPIAAAARAHDALFVSLLYLTMFASFGLYGPFAATFLQQAGLSATSVPLFFAATRMVRVVSSPSWAAFVDKRSSARDVLLWTSVPTALFFAWMAFAPAGWTWLAAYLAFVVLRGPAVSLCDVLALDAAERANTTYGKIRLWGTVGYVGGAFAAGALHERHQGRAVLLLALGATLLGGVSVFKLPRVEAPKSKSYLKDVRALLSRPRYVALIACASLHQLGLGTYDLLYAPWAASKTSGTIAGISIAVGGLAEVGFMLWGAPLLTRLGPHRSLALAFAASALRWILLGRWTSPTAIIGLQLFHALTFGCFYLAAVQTIERESPPTIRASAQGFFTTVAFGVAAAAGLAVASPLQRAGGITLVFDAASLCALLAAAIALFALAPAGDSLDRAQ
ncbi:MAG: MFS transporter [Polyangiales bacterium]